MGELRWTPEQVRAITSESHTLLTASAGTGKTTTIVGKILWLLGLDVGRDEDGEPLTPAGAPCSLREIAAITFTEKAAYDLKKKLRRAIAESKDAEDLRWEIDRASVGTIHAFCAEILRENALRFGIDPGFRVLDEREARVEIDSIIKDVIFEALDAGESDANELVRRFRLIGFKQVSGVIDHVRNVVRDLRWHPEHYAEWRAEGAPAEGEEEDQADRPAIDIQRLLSADAAFRGETEQSQLQSCAALIALAERAAVRWRVHLREESRRDFDSLILDTRELLTGPRAGAALARLRRRFRVLIIDEFQDTDAAQRDIAFAIAGVSASSDSPVAERAPQLLLVGDPKQSIYGFRGADISVWNETRQVICDSRPPLELTRNFRSDPGVIRFANAAAGGALRQVGEDVAREAPGARVEYTELAAGRVGAPDGGVDWLLADEKPVARQRDAEARQVAARIVEMVGELRVEDPENGERRPCRYGDIAILYRNTTGLQHYERALREHGVRYFSLGITGFFKTQEILDLVTAIRLIDNPRDDLRAFAYLRSPFVGLRDEVIARARMEGGPGSLLAQARRFSKNGTGWYAPPDDGADIAEIEREALARGLDAIERARSLGGRAPLDELLSDLLDRTGYPLQVILTDRAPEAMANIEKFLTLLEEYRDHPVGEFLEIWDRWDDNDTLVPQAPLYSKDDDVVTLSTIHGAKGLEWPVVFLVDTGQRFTDRLTHAFWSDPTYGPLLCPKQAERGPRSVRLHARRTLAERAEEARLLYVAVTRARDRFVVVGPTRSTESYAAWLARGEALAEHHAEPSEVSYPSVPAAVSLSWLEGIGERELPGLCLPIPDSPHRFTTSATEAMKRERDPKEWAKRYLHGVIETWLFAPRAPADEKEFALPPTERGKLIHDVLERIQEEDELAELLDERIGASDVPEIEEAMGRGTRYRRALEEEIRAVVRGERWRWYVEGEHYRELRFIRLARPRRWEVGAFDLYRPSGEGAEEGRDAGSWVVDFKTHGIGEDEIEPVALRYRLQAEIYRAAADMRDPSRVLLHFTRPNRALEMLPAAGAAADAPAPAATVTESAEEQLGLFE